MLDKVWGYLLNDPVSSLSVAQYAPHFEAQEGSVWRLVTPPIARALSLPWVMRPSHWTVHMEGAVTEGEFPPPPPSLVSCNDRNFSCPLSVIKLGVLRETLTRDTTALCIMDGE